MPPYSNENAVIRPKTVKQFFYTLDILYTYVMNIRVSAGAAPLSGNIQNDTVPNNFRVEDHSRLYG
jgi:hypothetical protein